MRKFNPLQLAMAFLIFSFFLIQFTNATQYVDYTGIVFSTTTGFSTDKFGIKFTANVNSTMFNVVKANGDTSTNCLLYNFGGSLLFNGTFIGDNCALNAPIVSGSTYCVLNTVNSGTFTQLYNASVSYPISGINVNYTGGCFNNGDNPTTGSVVSITTQIINASITPGFGLYTWNFTMNGYSDLLGGSGLNTNGVYYQQYDYVTSRPIMISYIDISPAHGSSYSPASNYSVVEFIFDDLDVNVSIYNPYLAYPPSGMTVTRVALNANATSGFSVRFWDFNTAIVNNTYYLSLPEYFNSSVTGISEIGMYLHNVSQNYAPGDCGLFPHDSPTYRYFCGSPPVNYMSIVAIDRPALVQSILSGSCSLVFQNDSTLYTGRNTSESPFYSCGTTPISSIGCDNVTSAQICVIRDYYTVSNITDSQTIQFNVTASDGTAEVFHPMFNTSLNNHFIGCGVATDLTNFRNNGAISGWGGFHYLGYPFGDNVQNTAIFRVVVNVMCVRGYLNMVGNCTQICDHGIVYTNGTYNYSSSTCLYSGYYGCRLGCGSVSSCAEDYTSGFVSSLSPILNVSSNVYTQNVIGLLVSTDIALFIILSIISVALCAFPQSQSFVLFITGALKCLLSITQVASGGVLLSGLFDIVLGIVKYSRYGR